MTLTSNALGWTQPNKQGRPAKYKTQEEKKAAKLAAHRRWYSINKFNAGFKERRQQTLERFRLKQKTLPAAQSAA